jgi:hypothetical protein
MDADLTQNPPLFSGLLTIATTPGNVAAWPSFVPDTSAVVFHFGQRFQTSAFGALPSYGNLRMAVLADQSIVELGALNGYSNGTFYLPYGEAEEANVNYEPTVLPVAVGGYYWVVFTSRRAYGNTIAPGGTVAGGDNPWGTFANNIETTSPRKKLWVAAIDINYLGKADPSHPAFYLPGQELEAGNMRAFAALEPCKPDGSACSSAAECCGGFCRETGQVDETGMPEAECVPPPAGCSNIDEACTSQPDCCGVSDLCINGRCTIPTPR